MKKLGLFFMLMVVVCRQFSCGSSDELGEVLGPEYSALGSAMEEFAQAPEFYTAKPIQDDLSPVAQNAGGTIFHEKYHWPMYLHMIALLVMGVNFVVNVVALFSNDISVLKFFIKAFPFTLCLLAISGSMYYKYCERSESTI